ncbi:MAG: hypothetical protein H0U23_04330 [Blastocatellia bacterium]|nr:hypothetical protein [Blastocatellia bacterium]
MPAVILTFETEDDLEEHLAELLRRAGWVCEKGGAWQPPWEVGKRYKVPPSKLSMQLSRYEQGGREFPCKRSPGGRLLRLKITPSLHEYLVRLNGGRK